MKNEETKTFVAGAIGYVGITGMGYLGFNEDLSAWAQHDLLEAMLAQAVQAQPAGAPRGKSMKELYFRIIVEERFKAPAVLPSGPWFTDQALQIVQALADNVITGQPATHWRYRIAYLRDTRASDRRVADAPNLAYRPHASIHQARTTLADYGRSVVGTANVGRVTFRASSGGAIDQVIHRLYWYASDTNGPIFDAPMFTEQVAPLTQPVPSERPGVFK
jgi:hypothetical protein